MTKPRDEVVDLVRALIRFDTSNTGELATTKGEAECARWVAEQLQEVGYETEYVESGAPGRGNVFTRLKGADSGPRRPDDPRAPRRGARRGIGLECASVLRCPRGRLRLGSRRRRHEGHGRHDDRGARGIQTRPAPSRRAIWCSRSSPTRRPAASTAAQWLVDERPDLFEGVTEAIGEVGGFSLTVPRRDGGERRLYLIETAEKAHAVDAADRRAAAPDTAR